jgi:hypothetical protein
MRGKGCEIWMKERVLNETHLLILAEIEDGRIERERERWGR